MQTVNDAHVVNLIIHLSEHYRANLATRFIRPLLRQLPLDNESWDHIDKLMEKSEHFRYQGFPVKELYKQIAAAHRMVALACEELASPARNRMAFHSGSGPDKVLRDMAINNLNANINVLGGLVNELFVSLARLDKAAAKGLKPIYERMPELDGLCQQFEGSLMASA